jgi:hypothetical protein
VIAPEPVLERARHLQLAFAEEMCGSKPIAGLTRGSAYRKYLLLPPG